MSEKEPTLDILEGDKRTPNVSEPNKAVAVQYDRATDDAPRVVASGKGAIADQILQIAFERGIKVREDAELVEILSLVDVDCPIPLEAFAAVAEILTYVYQANASFKQRNNDSQ